MNKHNAEKAEPCPNDCDRGLIACWSPGGPCSPAERATPCDLCGPCFHCRPGEHPMDDRANPPVDPGPYQERCRHDGEHDADCGQDEIGDWWRPTIPPGKPTAGGDQ